MYPSGTWTGYWEQTGFGQQTMTEFQLHFSEDGAIRGKGRDVVGKFSFQGNFDPHSGNVWLVKRYVKKHDVVYTGTPDGEGSILGTWSIYNGKYTGRFLLRPVIAKPRGDEPIFEIGGGG